MSGLQKGLEPWKVSGSLMVIGILLIIASNFWMITDLKSTGASKMMWVGGGFLAVGGIATACILYR